jgi:hypothetical protein
MLTEFAPRRTIVPPGDGIAGQNVSTGPLMVYGILFNNVDVNNFGVNAITTIDWGGNEIQFTIPPKSSMEITGPFLVTTQLVIFSNSDCTTVVFHSNPGM